MARTIKVDDDLYRELGRYGNRDEPWNDVIARVLAHVDEEKALEDRDNRTTGHTTEVGSAESSALAALPDGTVLRHVYRRGDYSGQTVEATVRGDRIAVAGDSEETRTPTGAARESDKLHRGNDARGKGYNGWTWWEYETDEGEWAPISQLKDGE